MCCVVKRKCHIVILFTNNNKQYKLILYFNIKIYFKEGSQLGQLYDYIIKASLQKEQNLC